MFRKKTAVADRRARPRWTAAEIEPPGVTRVDHAEPGKTMPVAQLLNISVGGAALRTSEPVDVGERLIFSVGAHQAPVHVEVLACEPLDEQGFRIHCKCIAGGFIVPA